MVAAPDATTAKDEAPSHDLTSRLLPNLDRHLALVLLNFLDDKALYPHDQMLRAKAQLLRPTNMVTYLAQIEKELDPAFDDKRLRSLPPSHLVLLLICFE